jgi:hypothetical protein
MDENGTAFNRSSQEQSQKAKTPARMRVQSGRATQALALKLSDMYFHFACAVYDYLFNDLL